MAPKKKPEPFTVDGVWFQANGAVINSKRIGGVSANLVVKVPRNGWKDDAERDETIRAKPGFEFLLALAAAADGEQPDVDWKPAARASHLVGPREQRALGETPPEPVDKAREAPAFFMHGPHSVPSVKSTTQKSVERSTVASNQPESGTARATSLGSG